MPLQAYNNFSNPINLLCSYGRALRDHRIKHSHCECSDSAACVRAGAAGRLLQADGFTFSYRLKKKQEKKHSHSLFPFFFLAMCNIFPCDGQIFISSSSVQMKSGKQSVLAQSLHSFPVQLYQCPVTRITDSSSSSHTSHMQFAGPHCTDFSCNSPPYILEAFQTSNMPASVFHSWILSGTAYEGCQTPKFLFNGTLRIIPGILAWQWNRKMKHWSHLWREGESPASFLKLPKFSGAARGRLRSLP